jgi:regulator of protease activity HflC (stomatin/prohibitin superfamily)
MLFYKKISVRPNQIGYLYQKNKFKKRLEPGVYRLFNFFSDLNFVALPTISKFFSVTNQEVLTKDNIALRFSYIIEYQIREAETFLAKFDILQKSSNPSGEAEQIIHYFSQVFLREAIATVDSQELNEKRHEFFHAMPENLTNQVNEYGIIIQRLMLRDITFPKAIQDLFAKQLEAKIRAKTELENARTTVATARALKNASEMMKGDDNIKFLKFLETITQIASKGKHTFIVGEFDGR